MDSIATVLPLELCHTRPLVLEEFQRSFDELRSELLGQIKALQERLPLEIQKALVAREEAARLELQTTIDDRLAATFAQLRIELAGVEDRTEQRLARLRGEVLSGVGHATQDSAALGGPGVGRNPTGSQSPRAGSMCMRRNRSQSPLKSSDQAPPSGIKLSPAVVPCSPPRGGPSLSDHAKQAAPVGPGSPSQPSKDQRVRAPLVRAPMAPIPVVTPGPVPLRKSTPGAGAVRQISGGTPMMAGGTPQRPLSMRVDTPRIARR